MTIKASPGFVGSAVEMLLQEHLAKALGPEIEIEPSELTVTIALDPLVPGGLAISARGHDLLPTNSLTQWLQSGDIGISSCSIFTAITKRIAPFTRDNDNWPKDPSDFGRCFRLLERFPTWRTELKQVSLKYPAWGPMIDVWPELEALYQEEIKNPRGMAPKLYARLQRLGEECKKKPGSGWAPQ